MYETLKSIGYSRWFTNFITFVIIAAGVLIGIETYPSTVEKYGGILHALDQLILWIFVVEVVLKMVAEGNKPWRYFLDPWNIFDFVIVVACFLPGAGDYVVVLRMARLLRVLKLVRALPKLQMLVTAMLKSIPSMFYVTILLGLLFYVYAVAAVFFFGPNDPVHFETLHLSMLSLFRVVTLEDWTDVMYIAMYGCDNYGYGDAMALCTAPNAQPILGAVFFSSFVLLGTMIVLNLFVGVILASMDETSKEHALAMEAEKLEAAGEEHSVENDLMQLARELEGMQERIALMRHRLHKDSDE
ncbi:MAG: ion transporter [Myxococcota bacterium]|jgi:voltage-gated sodium channel|nr:ion transporter [Myxococcota bacterium]